VRAQPWHRVIISAVGAREATSLRAASRYLVVCAMHRGFLTLCNTGRRPQWLGLEG